MYVAVQTYLLSDSGSYRVLNGPWYAGVSPPRKTTTSLRTEFVDVAQEKRQDSFPDPARGSSQNMLRMFSHRRRKTDGDAQRQRRDAAAAAAALFPAKTHDGGGGVRTRASSVNLDDARRSPPPSPNLPPAAILVDPVLAEAMARVIEEMKK